MRSSLSLSEDSLVPLACLLPGPMRHVLPLPWLLSSNTPRLGSVLDGALLLDEDRNHLDGLKRGLMPGALTATAATKSSREVHPAATGRREMDLRE